MRVITEWRVLLCCLAAFYLVEFTERGAWVASQRLGLAVLLATLWAVGWVGCSLAKGSLLQKWGSVLAIGIYIVALGAMVLQRNPMAVLYVMVSYALMRHTGEQHAGLVWLKRQMRRRGRPLSAFWEHVSDDYYWRAGSRHSGDGEATELEAADAPAGRGTEPEASPAPAGRGSELEPAGLSTADAETDADEARVRERPERGRYRG